MVQFLGSDSAPKPRTKEAIGKVLDRIEHEKEGKCG